MHPVLQGSIVGGGVGLALAAVRRPKEGQRDHVVLRVAKSVAEGAVAGAAVGFVVDRRLRGAAMALLADNAPTVVEAVGGALTGLAQRLEPTVAGAAHAIRHRLAA